MKVILYYFYLYILFLNHMLNPLLFLCPFPSILHQLIIIIFLRCKKIIYVKNSYVKFFEYQILRFNKTK